MRKCVFSVAVMLLACGSSVVGNVAQTKHNLSASGPGSVKTTETTAICVFCHTPHSAAPLAPLWNKNVGPMVYTTYSSSTLVSAPGQPDGASKLCLSCHDGTIAIGSIRNPDMTFTMENTSGGLLTGSSDLGSDLSNDHPVSFVPQSSPELVNPAPGDPVAYDAASGKLQCTSCHDPHNDLYSGFLVKSNIGSAVCKTCHHKSLYDTSAHDTSLATWNGGGTDPWPVTTYTNVADNSCGNCHVPHNSGTNERLLTQSGEDNVCKVCHNGNVGNNDIYSDLSKLSGHFTESYNGIHDPTEDVVTMAKHVECVDCHNPHAVNNDAGVPPLVDGDLRNVSGADLSGNPLAQATNQYEVCIKCHGSNANFNIIPFANRAIDTSNIRVAINPSNQSYHPIAAQGQASSVPSLLPEYTTSSIIYCTDCHNSDMSINAGGSGPNGPHGSSYEFILERRYEMADGTAYAPDVYALCFKCHNATQLIYNRGNFVMLHKKHVLNDRCACSDCHDPHGVPAGTADDGDHMGLINFDLNVVSPNANGLLKLVYEPQFAGRRSCYMSCHGHDHNGSQYKP
jgi:predicted CXXCH cytochrome family protein